MYSVRPLPEFTAWIDGLKDRSIRDTIVARIKRLERGLLEMFNLLARVSRSYGYTLALVGDCISPYVVRKLLCFWSADRNERKRRTSTAPKHWLQCFIERRI
jgi:hypothetical protein